MRPHKKSNNSTTSTCGPALDHWDAPFETHRLVSLRLHHFPGKDAAFPLLGDQFVRASSEWFAGEQIHSKNSIHIFEWGQSGDLKRGKARSLDFGRFSWPVSPRNFGAFFWSTKIFLNEKNTVNFESFFFSLKLFNTKITIFAKESNWWSTIQSFQSRQRKI